MQTDKAPDVQAKGHGLVGTKATHPASPIDHVYTWVNGSDEELRLERERYARREVAQDYAYVAGPSRYQDHGELRAALDNAQRMLPFVHHTYVFGAGRAPEWFKSFRGGVTYVDQRTVIPQNEGPFFQSDAVESYIHKIPGLSERYIYSNDDCFFARPHAPADFFDDAGVARVGLGAWMVGDDASPTFRSIGANSVRALQRRMRTKAFDTGLTAWPRAGHEVRGRIQYFASGFKLRRQGLRPINAISHVSQPFTKSTWERFNREFALEVAEVRAHRFRSSSAYAINLLYQYFAASIGMARLALSDDRLLLRSQSVSERKKLLEDLCRPASPVARFCLNDTPVDREDGWSDYVGALLDTVLAKKGGDPSFAATG